MALKSLQGDAIGFGVVLLNWGEQAEVLGGGAEQSRVLFRFAGLFGEFGFCAAIPIFPGLFGELGIHRCVFVGLPFNR